MSAIETRQLFNFIQGSDISGVSSYDIWKSLNPNGTEAEFLEYIRSGPQGEQGPEGPQGSSARVYFLMCSDNVIERTIHDTLLPSSITFNAYYREGTNAAKINYTGRFIIQETTDGYTWTNKYTSNVDESSVNFIPSSTEVKFIKCKLYAAGGTTEELDAQNIPILTDAGLIKVLVATLSNEAHTISCDYNGENCNYEGCNTQVKVYSGVTEVTQSATFNINTSKGVTGAWDENTHVYTITDLSVENGYVDFEITFGGNSIVKRFTVAKIKAGANGEPGSSTYDIWVSSGHEGDVNDFLEFLKGEPGPKGQSTYEVWTGLGNTGTAQEFIESLKGEPGEAGPQGEPGSSTYDIWVSSGHEGDVNDFLEFLKGKDGTSVTILGTKNNESELPTTENNDGDAYIIGGDLFVWNTDKWTNVGQVRGPQGEQGPEGPQGPKGQSTYDIWKSIEGNEDGTVQDFLNYLKDDGESNVSEETLAQIEKNKNDISQLTQEIDYQKEVVNKLDNMITTGEQFTSYYTPASITTGGYMSPSGKVMASSDTSIGYTEKISVTTGQIIKVVVNSTALAGAEKYISPVMVTAYNNGVVDSSLGLSNATEAVDEYIVPDGVTEIIVSANFYKTGYSNQRISITERDKGRFNLTEFDNSIKALRNDYAWSMPKKVFARVGENIKLYLRNLNTSNYPVIWGQYLSNATIYNYDDYIEIVPTATGSKNVAYKVYDNHLNLVEEGTTNLIISDTAPSSQTMLLIGDSTIASGNIATNLINLFSTDGNTVTLLGTQGSGNAKHEGYSGKKLSDFANGFSDSPFGTSGFNFSTYMSSNGYSGVDTVVIQGGINDTNNLSINSGLSNPLSALATMIESILSYNSNIKILVNLVTMPTSISENFAIKYGTGNCNWIARHNAQRLNKLIIEQYANNASVTCVATNAVLDTTEDIVDNVHPTSDGYEKLAKQIYYTLMGL